MASNGIRDRVAIVGMGCTPFGEHWDKSADDLLIDAVDGRARRRPASTLDDVDAFWLGTHGLRACRASRSRRPLKIDYKPVTRVENFCATGSEAFRNACYAVASGAYDVAMAIGVEKLKDSGFSGLAGIGAGRRRHRRRRSPRRPRSRSSRPAYAKKYGVDEDEMKDVLTRIAWKNHQQRRAQPAGAVPQGGAEGDDRAARRSSPARSASSTARASATARRRRSSCRAEDAHSTPTTRCT